MEPLGSGHRDPEGGVRSSIAKAAAFLGYELKNEQEESVKRYICVSAYRLWQVIVL